MQTIGAVLAHFTIQDYARLTEKAEREQRANDRLLEIERARQARETAAREDERAALIEMGRPEYIVEALLGTGKCLRNAQRKERLYENERLLRAAETAEAPRCRKCGGRMFLRQPKAGKAWRVFWGCGGFPSCDGKVEVAADENHGFTDSTD